MSNKSSSIADWFASRWLAAAYGTAKWIYLFYPLSLLFALVIRVRRFCLTRFKLETNRRNSIPIIVIGNINLGGTGKTPVLIALVEYFQKKGFKVGVISRGYGGSANHYPCVIESNSTAQEVGDEPLMIFRRTAATVCVGSNRVASAQKLLDLGCTLLLSDDGLQHYQLARDLEILVVDAARQFGNRQLIPAGPLREPVGRVSSVDFILVNETQSESPEFCNELVRRLNQASVYRFKLVPQHFVQVATEKIFTLSEIKTQLLDSKTSTHLVAGIGNPKGFFSSVEALGLSGKLHAFPDHYAFTIADFETFEDAMVIMTEKDAVKVKDFAKPNWFYLVGGVELDPQLINQLELKLTAARNAS